jgi:hypothetical protein
VARETRRDKALGVAVEAAYTVGEYDIVILSAQQSDGLETWLRENGYRMPRGAAAALQPYIRQQMKFFVAKVNLEEQARTGAANLRPLQFAFESERFMLPGPQDSCAVRAPRRVRRATNYRTSRCRERRAALPRAGDRDLPGIFWRQRANHRALFTEYFDMSWCDRAADPTPANCARPGSGERRTRRWPARAHAAAPALHAGSLPEELGVPGTWTNRAMAPSGTGDACEAAKPITESTHGAARAQARLVDRAPRDVRAHALPGSAPLVESLWK